MHLINFLRQIILYIFVVAGIFEKIKNNQRLSKLFCGGNKMNEQRSQNKKAWEYRAYEFWNK